MTSRSLAVFVTGATGTQGSGVVRELLQAYKATSSTITLSIHALARTPDSPAAQALVALDPDVVKLFKGDFDDVDALAAAASGCATTFLNVTPSFTDPEAETRHARNILSTSLAAGVKHVILSSTNATDKYRDFKNVEASPQILHYWKTKSAIIDLVRSPPFPTPSDYVWTVLQPASCLTNFFVTAYGSMFPELQSETPSISTAYGPNVRLSYLDPDDIGRFVATIVFSDRATLQAKFAGQTIRLASVNLTTVDLANALTRAVDGRKTVTVHHYSPEETEEMKGKSPFVASQIFMNDNEDIMLVDIDVVRAYGVKLGGVDEFFQREKKRVEEALAL